MRGGGWVLDGRDSGSVVAPYAELKIYLDCDINERARRRALDQGITDEQGIAEIKKSIEERDERDRGISRGQAQLRILPDAIVVDTTSITIQEQVDIIYRLAQDKLATLV